jgi:hypothetical protein
MKIEMNSANGTLRVLVEKWLGPTPETQIKVVGFGRLRAGRRRFVCVEARRPGGTLAVYFFHHKDGTWRVFPPASERPAMDILWRVA